MRHNAMHVLSVGLLMVSLTQLADASWIHLKANLAQHLIARAWQSAQSMAQTGEQTGARTTENKPWPWADTFPVARMRYFPANAPDTALQDLYVLAGAQGNSLAFGPGHLFGSALPGTAGVSIIGGHRDTHFRFLQYVAVGDQFSVTSQAGGTQRYRVTATHIADSLVEPLTAMRYASQILLVTCYPFDALQQGPLRYVVTAELIDAEPAPQETML